MKTKPFLIALISFCAVLALAENQKGYVKTKGRLNKNGTVIAGSKLSGVSIIIKNQNAIISNKDGGFSFRVTGQSYELDSVTKNNYVLADPDILFKSYSYSKNPLVLVMEDKKQQENDRKDLERKVTRNLYALIDKKNEEIESLKEQKKISDEEYDKLRQKINKEQDDNVSIIKRMVDEYMKIDFDREDDIDKEIANHILNGELTKADSVICTMGDFEQLEQELKRIHDANATGRKALEKSMAVENNKRNRLARNYYSKSQIALLRHQNDSVAYYLERRARLDSTNIRWLLDAGEFIHEFTADYVKAKEFYDRALEESSKQQNDYFTAESYNNIANLYHLQGNNKEALSFYEKAITLMQQVRGNDCWEVARYYGNIGSVNTSLKDLQKALDYNRKALDIYQNSADDKIKDIDKARGYNNIGQSEIELGHYDEGEGYLKKGLEIASKLSGNDRGVLFELYNNLGNYYYIMRKLTPAGECFDSARVVAETIYGPYNPKTALVTMNLGVLYTNTGDFEKGYDYILKGVNIHKNLTGENNTTVMTGYSSLAILCGDYLKRYDEELSYAKKAFAIAEKLYAPNSLGMAQAYHALSGAYKHQKDLDQSFICNEKVAEITRAAGKGAEELLAHSLNDNGTIYYWRKDYEKAIDYLCQAMEVFNAMKERGGADAMKHVAKSIIKTLDKAIEEKSAKKSLRKKVEDIKKTYPDSFN